MASNRTGKTFSRWEVRRAKDPYNREPNQLGDLRSWATTQAEARLMASKDAHDNPTVEYELVEATYRVVDTYDKKKAIAAFERTESDPN